MKTATPFVMTTAIPIRTAGYLKRRGFIQKAAIIADENKTLLAKLTTTTRAVLQSENRVAKCQKKYTDQIFQKKLPKKSA